MSGALVVALGVPTILLLLLSGLWADRRFAKFDELPAHYDFKGRPTRFASRRLMVWLTPFVFVSGLAITLLPMWLVPPEMQNGNPVTGAVLVCVVLLAGQGVILWLHDRWAKAQNG